VEQDKPPEEGQKNQSAPAAPPARQAVPAAPPAAAAARPVAPPKPEAPSLTPLQMVSPMLRSFLERLLGSGETVTVEVGKDAFTGRIFRLMLHEGWIALEHVDGRRRMFFIITGGKITAKSGEVVELAGAHAK
jgi:hypothetical protein